MSPLLSVFIYIMGRINNAYYIGFCEDYMNTTSTWIIKSLAERVHAKSPSSNHNRHEVPRHFVINALSKAKLVGKYGAYVSKKWEKLF